MLVLIFLSYMIQTMTNDPNLNIGFQVAKKDRLCNIHQITLLRMFQARCYTQKAYVVSVKNDGRQIQQIAAICIFCVTFFGKNRIQT